MFASNGAKFDIQFNLLFVKEASFVNFPSIVSMCTYSQNATCLSQNISAICSSHHNLVKSEYNLKIHESVVQFNYATNSFLLSFC
jgi:hypothetical protein